MPSDPDRPRGTFRLASVSGVEIRISPSTVLLLAFLSFAVTPQLQERRPDLPGPVAMVLGLGVGVLVYAAVLAHEAGHAVVARRHGRAVGSITLSAFGGRTVVDGEAATPREEFVTAVVGPAVSLALGAVALGVRLPLDDSPLALVLEVLVLANLVLGGLDLLPAPPLDGSRLVKAVAWRLSGSPSTGSVASAQVGRAVAAVLALGPILLLVLGLDLEIADLLFGSIIGALLWAFATADLDNSRLRRQVGAVVVRDLARPVIAVTPDLPLAEALRRGEEAGARAVVTLDPAGAASGLVTDDLLEQIPAERRPWVPTYDATRAIADDLRLPVDVTGDELLAAIRRTPSSEYVLVGPGDAVVGVLALSDLDRAVRRK